MFKREDEPAIGDFKLQPTALCGGDTLNQNINLGNIMCLEETLAFCILLNRGQVFISAIEVLVIVESFFFPDGN